ncbi:MAG: hypothetical protein K0R39_4972, partial [Symbiobacteriaceae bacterium]|nr:hypothetical protein [Symbiobacteriaceae bacterium]
DQVYVLAVGGDPREGADKLLGYADNQQLQFTVLFDEGQAVLTYKALGLPTTFAVDQNGVIREKVMGAMSLERMRDIVARTQEAGQKTP